MIGAQAGSSQRMKRVKKYFPLFLMMVPGFIYLLINNYLPMFGLVIAFKDIDFTKGILASGWAGLKNFKYLFSTADAFIITRNTILYNITFITLDLIVAVFLAILLHEIMESYSSKVYQTVLLLPYMISTVIVGYLVYAFLNVRTGYVNTKLGPLFGFPRSTGIWNHSIGPLSCPLSICGKP